MTDDRDISLYRFLPDKDGDIPTSDSGKCKVVGAIDSTTLNRKPGWRIGAKHAMRTLRDRKRETQCQRISCLDRYCVNLQPEVSIVNSPPNVPMIYSRLNYDQTLPSITPLCPPTMIRSLDHPINLTYSTPEEMLRKSVLESPPLTCTHCGSTNVTLNPWVHNVESYVCSACKRKFVPPKCISQIVGWNIVKEVVDDIYGSGNTIRDEVASLARKQIPVNPMFISRMLNTIGAAIDAPMTIARKYRLKFSPYLCIDLTYIPIRRHRTPNSELTEFPVLFAGDPMTTYAFQGRMVHVDLPKSREDKVLVDAYIREIDEIMKALGREYENSLRVVIVDPERALISAIKTRLPTKRIQVDTVHVIRKVEKILPTIRKSKLPEDELEARRKLKDTIRSIMASTSRIQFDVRLSDLLTHYDGFDEKKKKALRVVQRYKDMLKTHFAFEDAPKTSNFAERLIQEVEEPLDKRRGFNSYDSADRNLSLYLNCFNFRKIRSSKTGLEGYTAFQLAGGLIDTHWLDVVYKGEQRTWRARVRKESKNIR